MFVSLSSLQECHQGSFSNLHRTWLSILIAERRQVREGKENRERSKGPGEGHIFHEGTADPSHEALKLGELAPASTGNKARPGWPGCPSIWDCAGLYPWHAGLSTDHLWCTWYMCISWCVREVGRLRAGICETSNIRKHGLASEFRIVCGLRIPRNIREGLAKCPL